MRKLFTTALPVLVLTYLSITLTITSCRLDEGPIVVSQVGDIPVEFEFEVGILKSLTKSEQRSLYEFDSGFEESFATSSDSLLSKTALSDESKVSNLWVFQFNNGANDGASILALPPSYLHSVSSSGKIEPLLVKGANQRIILIANTSNSKLFDDMFKGVSTLSELKAKSISIEQSISKGLIPMVGEFVGNIHSDGTLSSTSTDAAHVSSNHIPLKRLLSRINIRYKVIADLQDQQNNGSATLKVTSVKLVNVPMTTSLFPKGLHTDTGGADYTGNTTTYTAYEDKNNADANFPHYDNTAGGANSIIFYMPENIGGIWNDSTLSAEEIAKSSNKTEPKNMGDKSSTASYIEIECTHTPYAGGHNSITYITYLGNSRITNYNIQSNYNYLFTINLNGVQEGGRISHSLPTVETMSPTYPIDLKGTTINSNIKAYGTGASIVNYGIVYGLNNNVMLNEVGEALDRNNKIPGTVATKPPAPESFTPASGHIYKSEIINKTDAENPVFTSNQKYYYRPYLSNSTTPSSYAYGSLDSIETGVIVNMPKYSISIVEGTDPANPLANPRFHFHGRFAVGGNRKKHTDDDVSLGFVYSSEPSLPAGETTKTTTGKFEKTSVSGDSTYFITTEAILALDRTKLYYVKPYVREKKGEQDRDHTPDAAKELFIYAALTMEPQDVTTTTVLLGGHNYGLHEFMYTYQKGIEYHINDPFVSEPELLYKDISQTKAEETFTHPVSGLQPNTDYKTRAYVVGENANTNVPIKVYGSTKEFRTKVDLSTYVKSGTQKTALDCGGEYTIGTVKHTFLEYGILISEKGISADYMKIVNGGNTGHTQNVKKQASTNIRELLSDGKVRFDLTVPTLKENTEWQIVSYFKITNTGVAADDYVYGALKFHWTLDPQGLQTQIPTPQSTTSTRAALHSVFTSGDGFWYDAGFVYGLNSHKLPMNIEYFNNPENETYGKLKKIAKLTPGATDNQIPVGPFTLEVSDLLPNSEYAVQSYIELRKDEGYLNGNKITFTTNPVISKIGVTPVGINELSLPTVTFTSTIAKGGGKVTHNGQTAFYGNDGRLSVVGVVIKEKDAYGTLPEYPGDKHDGGDNTNLLYEGVPVTSALLTLPTLGVTYIARTYALKTTDETKTPVYGATQEFAPIDVPDVTTSEAVHEKIQTKAATLGGTIKDVGVLGSGSDVKKHGIRWVLPANVSEPSKWIEEQVENNLEYVDKAVAFELEIGLLPDKGLTPNTRYFYRAYGINEQGGGSYYGYGEQKIFYTDAEVTAVTPLNVTSTGGEFEFTVSRGGDTRLEEHGFIFMEHTAENQDPLPSHDVSVATHIAKKQPIFGAQDKEANVRKAREVLTSKLDVGTRYTVYSYALMPKGKYVYKKHIFSTIGTATVATGVAEAITPTGALIRGNQVSKSTTSIFTAKGIAVKQVISNQSTEFVDKMQSPMANHDDEYDHKLTGLLANAHYEYKAVIDLDQEKRITATRSNIFYTSPIISTLTESKKDETTVTFGYTVAKGANIELNTGLLLMKHEGLTAVDSVAPEHGAISGALPFPSHDKLFGMSANNADREDQSISTFGLDRGVTYSAYAYTQSPDGVYSYGRVHVFTTLVKPTVTAAAATDITSTTATFLNNAVTRIATTAEYKARGITHSTDGWLAPAKTVDFTDVTPVDGKPDEFNVTVNKGLSPNTKYDYRAFVEIDAQNLRYESAATTVFYTSPLITEFKNTNEALDDIFTFTFTVTRSGGVELQEQGVILMPHAKDVEAPQAVNPADLNAKFAKKLTAIFAEPGQSTATEPISVATEKGTLSAGIRYTAYPYTKNPVNGYAFGVPEVILVPQIPTVNTGSIVGLGSDEVTIQSNYVEYKGDASRYVKKGIRYSDKAAFDPYKDALLVVINEALDQFTIRLATPEHTLLANTKYYYKAFVELHPEKYVFDNALHNFSTHPIWNVIAATDTTETTAHFTISINKGGGAQQRVGVIMMPQNTGTDNDIQPADPNLPAAKLSTETQIWIASEEDQTDPRKINVTVSTLEPGKYYAAYPFAKDERGTYSYGEPHIVLTWYKPEVRATAASAVTQETATIAGNTYDAPRVTSDRLGQGINFKKDETSAVWQKEPQQTGPFTTNFDIDLTGLTSNTSYIYRAYLDLKPEGEVESTDKTFITNPFINSFIETDVDQYGKRFTFNILKGGNVELVDQGVLLMKHTGNSTTTILPNLSGGLPFYTGIKIFGTNSQQAASAPIEVTATGLERGTYYSAYPFTKDVKNPIVYGAQKLVKTLQIPTITAGPASDIKTTSVKFTGNTVAGLGANSTYVTRGITRSTNNWGDSLDFTTVTEATRTGFNVELTGLTANTEYSTKAFIIIDTDKRYQSEEPETIYTSPIMSDLTVTKNGIAFEFNFTVTRSGNVPLQNQGVLLMPHPQGDATKQPVGLHTGEGVITKLTNISIFGTEDQGEDLRQITLTPEGLIPGKRYTAYSFTQNPSANPIEYAYGDVHQIIHVPLIPTVLAAKPEDITTTSAIFRDNDAGVKPPDSEYKNKGIRYSLTNIFTAHEDAPSTSPTAADSKFTVNIAANTLSANTKYFYKAFVDLSVEGDVFSAAPYQFFCTHPAMNALMAKDTTETSATFDISINKGGGAAQRVGVVMVPQTDGNANTTLPFDTLNTVGVKMSEKTLIFGTDDIGADPRLITAVKVEGLEPGKYYAAYTFARDEISEFSTFPAYNANPHIVRTWQKPVVTASDASIVTQTGAILKTNTRTAHHETSTLLEQGIMYKAVGGAWLTQKDEELELTTPFSIDLKGRLNAANTQYDYKAYVILKPEGKVESTPKTLYTAPNIRALTATNIAEDSIDFTFSIIKDGNVELSDQGILLMEHALGSATAIAKDYVNGKKVYTGQPIFGTNAAGTSVSIPLTAKALKNGYHYTIYPFAINAVTDTISYGSSVTVQTLVLATVTAGAASDTTISGATFGPNTVTTIATTTPFTFVKRGMRVQEANKESALWVPKWNTGTVDQTTNPFTSTLDDLTSNTVYNYVAAIEVDITGQVRENIVIDSDPVLQITTLANPGVTTATLSTTDAKVSFAAPLPVGGSAVLKDKGIVVGATITPTIDVNTAKISNGTAVANITAAVNVSQEVVANTLRPNTPYFARAYVTNAGGTSYGAVSEQFTTPSVPTVQTTSATVVGNKVRLVGKVVNNGGALITHYGFSYSLTDVTPTLDEVNTPTAAQEVWTTPETAGVVVDGGTFTLDVPLKPIQTLMHVRAYARNGVGVGENLDDSDVQVARVVYVNRTEYQNGNADGGDAVWIGDTKAWWAPFGVGNSQIHEYIYQGGLNIFNFDDANSAKCPDGWDVPSFDQYRVIEGQTGSADWEATATVKGMWAANKSLFFPAPNNSAGACWTSDDDHTSASWAVPTARIYRFLSSGDHTPWWGQYQENALRCVKNPVITISAEIISPNMLFKGNVNAEYKFTEIGFLYSKTVHSPLYVQNSTENITKETATHDGGDAWSCKVPLLDYQQDTVFVRTYGKIGQDIYYGAVKFLHMPYENTVANGDMLGNAIYVVRTEVWWAPFNVGYGAAWDPNVPSQHFSQVDKNACPDGWRLPTIIEATKLYEKSGDASNQYYFTFVGDGQMPTSYESASGWKTPNNELFFIMGGYNEWYTMTQARYWLSDKIHPNPMMLLNADGMYIGNRDAEQNKRCSVRCVHE